MERLRKSAPRKKDKFWQAGRGSGYIIGVDYTEKKVFVKFYGDRKNIFEYDWDYIEDKWTDHFGGTYRIEDPDPG